MPIIKKTGFESHPVGVFKALLIDIEEAESFNPDWPAQFKCSFETDAARESGQPRQRPSMVGLKRRALLCF